MKLDTHALRYLDFEDWRVLTAVETGSKNHEVVPTPLIAKISGLRSGGGVHKCISTLAKANLIAKVKNAKYDGYRLTYGGLDYLALHTHTKQKTLYSVGNQIGIGKESDIFVVASSAGTQHVLKLHRLGRISFRTVRTNRDYLRGRSSGSWLYMSKLAALKEFTFMKALRDVGFVVPEPIAQSRHTVVMSLIDAFPLRQIREVPDPAGLYSELIDIVLRLASFGLIHGDFNEFNILLKEELDPHMVKQTEKRTAMATSMSIPTPLLVPYLIDFPQMVSIDHANAAMYFDRDVRCIKQFFQRRFQFVSEVAGPTFEDARSQVGKIGNRRLDVEVEASGFSKRMAKDLETYMQNFGAEEEGVGQELEADENESGDGQLEDGNE